MFFLLLFFTSIFIQQKMSQKELINDLTRYWKEHKIFQKSIDQRSDTLKAITYDGPPFASGEPHF